MKTFLITRAGESVELWALNFEGQDGVMMKSWEDAEEEWALRDMADEWCHEHGLLRQSWGIKDDRTAVFRAAIV